MLQNQGRVYIANFSGVDASKGDTTTTKPVSTTGLVVKPSTYTPRPLPTSTTTTSRPPASTTTTPPPVAIPPAVVITPPPASLGGGMGGGGGASSEEKATEQSTTDTAIGSGHNMEIIAYSSFAFVAGAVGGYFLGKKMEKNPWLFAGIGGVVLGLATYGITTKFVYPSAEKTSGFLGFTKKRKKNIDRDEDITGRYPTGNAGRKECERDGGTVIFPNSGGWWCDIKK